MIAIARLRHVHVGLIVLLHGNTAIAGAVTAVKGLSLREEITLRELLTLELLTLELLAAVERLLHRGIVELSLLDERRRLADPLAIRPDHPLAVGLIEPPLALMETIALLQIPLEVPLQVSLNVSTELGVVPALELVPLLELILSELVLTELILLGLINLSLALELTLALHAAAELVLPLQVLRRLAAVLRSELVAALLIQVPLRSPGSLAVGRSTTIQLIPRLLGTGRRRRALRR